MSSFGTDLRMKAESVTIRPLQTFEVRVKVLGSKSYSNRYLALAALSGEATTIEGALVCDDTQFLAGALRAFGHVEVEIDAAAERITVTPTGRPMTAPAEEVYVGAAGTPIRFLIAMAGHADGTTVLTGTKRMQERPMGSLFDALPGVGVTAEAVRG
ncbi:3-phosphoshikimate 1-carboxyvinyltransferase, partial [Streptomyces platensis subsp. clarensis]|nr:3-phosphoshikimate 1-carboxyvinyltransferase [Streptomyces platensis subsp. clarensis]